MGAPISTFNLIHGYIDRAFALHFEKIGELASAAVADDAVDPLLKIPADVLPQPLLIRIFIFLERGHHDGKRSFQLVQMICKQRI
jgi:hypothetical protein